MQEETIMILKSLSHLFFSKKNMFFSWMKEVTLYNAKHLFGLKEKKAAIQLVLREVAREPMIKSTRLLYGNMATDSKHNSILNPKKPNYPWEKIKKITLENADFLSSINHKNAAKLLHAKIKTDTVLAPNPKPPK